MRTDLAALKACTGILALCWATGGFALSGGTAPLAGPHPTVPKGAAPPSIRFLPTQSGLAGTCGGSDFFVNTFINVTAQSSADGKVSVPGVGTIEEFTDETGKNIGPYDDAYPAYRIPGFGGGLAPDTLITITITTYSDPTLTGSVTFVSSLVFDCTTGAVISLAPDPSAPVPALSPFALAATAVLLLLLGAVLLRSSAVQRRVPIGMR